VFEPLLLELARDRPVYAPDLPDNGSSDTLASPTPTIADYADAVATTAGVLQLEGCDLYAVGAGAAVALELLDRPVFTGAGVLLDTPDFYPSDLAHQLLTAWAPPLTPEWDGAHLNRIWLMLRDEYAYWPWYDKSAGAARALDAPADWQQMHARASDILRSLPTYHRLTAAAMRYDWRAPLQAVDKESVRMAASSNDPRRDHTGAAARSADMPDVPVMPTAPAEKARAILALLTGGDGQRGQR
jgi:pimeloyl-ACP methyl ester carboxylesterase